MNSSSLTVEESVSELTMVFKLTCLVVLVFGFTQSAVLPSVQKCKLGDSACLTPAFQKMMPIFMVGISENKVDVLDPMDMDDLAFELAGLQFTLKGGILRGLKNSVVDNVDWDTKKKNFAVNFHLDVAVKGHYTAAGRILILPITGDGQLKLKLKNLAIKLVIYYDIVKNVGGKDIIKPKKYKIDFEVKDSAHYHLSNLFNGNKQLSEAMLTFLNDNGKQIADEFGGPMMDLAARTIFKNVKNYFEAMPIEEITSA
ncbi:hypothetical protein PYW08_003290 [Mythimna loreyi]|uniref:Uncharacterized protein n=1 Tax=Mythimna loreyi TaxID=667449 RepID=A0ACC2QRD1_9NEOP|nr:hypothetical protein PYW08_003290 [Mythimna loreyi]